MPDPFWTVAEIAATLKVNQQSVRNWIDRGELEAVRIGSRRVRIRQSQLDEFLHAGGSGQQEAATAVDADGLKAAARRVGRARTDAGLAEALRALAAAADQLATELEVGR